MLLFDQIRIEFNIMREFSIFHLSKPEWEASKIGMKCNGGWSVFTDPITHKSLNSPRAPYPEPKIIYRRKTEEQLEQEELIRNWREIKTKKKGNNFNNFSTVSNPLLNPPKDNYKEFRARKHIVSSRNSNNDLDDYQTLNDGILTSRSMPKKPQKAVQFARDLQITTLNTQRYSRYSHSSLARCTPRSQDTLTHHADEETEDAGDFEEEITEEIQFNLPADRNTSLEQNMTVNFNINEDMEPDKSKIDSKKEDMDSNANEFSNDCINNIQEKEELSNDKKSIEYMIQTHDTVNIEETATKDDITDQNKIERESKTLVTDNVEIIKIKIDVNNIDKSDNKNLADTNSAESDSQSITNKITAHNTSNDETEVENMKDQISSNNDNANNIESNDGFPQKLKNDDNKNKKQWKNKRTGKVISRKVPINNENSIKSDQRNDMQNLELFKSKSQKIIVRSSIKKGNSSSDQNEIQDPNQNNFKYSQPNDKVINYKFKYNNSRSCNLQRSRSRNTFTANKHITKITKNKNTIHKKDTLGEKDDQVNNNSNLNKKTHSTNSNTNNDASQNNISNDIIKSQNLDENAQKNDINTDDSQNNLVIDIEIENNDTECDNHKNDDNTENDENNILNNTEYNKNTKIDNNNDKTDTQNDNNNNDKTDTHSDNNNNDNTVDIIIDTGDDTDIIKNDNNSNQSDLNISIDIANANNSNSSQNKFDTNLDDNEKNYSDPNLPDSDSVNDETDSYSSNTRSDSQSISSKNTKKVSNIYGCNYNDYNYYGNVIRTNSKLNAPGNTLFQFTGTTNNGYSNLTTEISHNYSPLPSTRRPATATRQRYIERPECIGPERFFKGDDPAPARRFFQSANLVSEMRREEELKMLANAKVKRNLSKTVNRKGPSLYERSIKPREKLYCWPRDFANFTAE